MLEEGILTLEEFLHLAEARSKIYGFLSSVYMQIPDRDFVKKLRGKEVSLLLLTLSPDSGLPEEMENGLEDVKGFIMASKGQPLEKVCQSLSVDRTRLLRGIKPEYSPPPPYESVYRDGELSLMGKSAVEVHGEYAKAGVGMPDEYKEPPDYIGLELDFMRFLAEREAESWRKEERDKALDCLIKERTFLEEHITKWIPEFCDRVIGLAEFGFYRGIARMTKGFVTDDLEKVDSFISMLKNN